MPKSVPHLLHEAHRHALDILKALPDSAWLPGFSAGCRLSTGVGARQLHGLAGSSCYTGRRPDPDRAGLTGDARRSPIGARAGAAQRQPRYRLCEHRKRRGVRFQPDVHPGALPVFPDHPRPGFPASLLDADREGHDLAALPGYERMRLAGNPRGWELDGPAGSALQHLYDNVLYYAADLACQELAKAAAPEGCALPAPSHPNRSTSASTC